MKTLVKKIYAHSTEFRGMELRLKILKVVAKLILPEYRFKGPQVDWWLDCTASA